MSEQQHQEEERKNVGRKDGQWTSTVTDADLIAAVRDHSPAATSEVGEAVDMTRAGAYKRLTKLHDAGRVDKKKIAASVVWFVSDDNGDSEPLGSGDGSTDTFEDGLSPSGVTEDVVSNNDE